MPWVTTVLKEQLVQPSSHAPQALTVRRSITYRKTNACSVQLAATALEELLYRPPSAQKATTALLAPAQRARCPARLDTTSTTNLTTDTCSELGRSQTAESAPSATTAHKHR